MISTKIIDSNCMSIFKLMQPNKEAQKTQIIRSFRMHLTPSGFAASASMERKKGS